MVCIVRNAGVQSSGPWWWCRLSSHHVLPEQMLSSAVWCSWSTGFQWLSMWDHLQRWRFFVLISMSPLRSLEGISPCREATLPARQDPKVWGVILDGYWNQKISVFFADIWTYLNLLSWTTQAMSPGHFTHASLYLCFVMPLKLTESHFCRYLRKAWVEKRRTKIQGERSSTRSHTCRTPAAPGSHETCRRFDWILLGFSNWHVLGMMIPYDTLCTNWLCNSKILCHCAVAKIDKKYKESCVWFGWFSLAFCDCDRFFRTSTVRFVEAVRRWGELWRVRYVQDTNGILPRSGDSSNSQVSTNGFSENLISFGGKQCSWCTSCPSFEIA